MTSNIDSLVEQNFEAQLSAIEQLVNLPSHTYAKDDVERAARCLDKLAENVGFVPEIVTATDDRFANHRVYRFPNHDPAVPSLTLVGHIDTVFPRSSGFLEFRCDGDRAYGPGVLDMKSGLAAILFGVLAAKSAGDIPQIQFICVTDEEVGSPCSRDFYDALAPTMSEALVFEKGRTEDKIVTSRKGGGSFVVEAFGAAAHAGNHHEKGRNAIHALATLIPRLEQYTDYEKGNTINVGLIEGGTAKNTVPEYAKMVIDARFVTVSEAQAFVSVIEEWTSEPCTGRLEGVRFALSGGITRPPMEETPQISALAERYGAVATESGLGSGAAPRQGGFSDANLIAPHGVPVIDGLGAYGEGAHSTDEWCDLESLRRRTAALARFILR